MKTQLEDIKDGAVIFKLTGNPSSPTPQNTFAELKAAYDSGKNVRVMFGNTECHRIQVYADAYIFLAFVGNAYGNMLLNLCVCWFMWKNDDTIVVNTHSIEKDS